MEMNEMWPDVWKNSYDSKKPETISLNHVLNSMNEVNTDKCML